MTKNLIKMLAALDDDVDLEGIYNELGVLLGKNKETSNDIKEPSLKEYFGMKAPNPEDMVSMLMGVGFAINTDTNFTTVHDKYGDIGVIRYDKAASIYSTRCILNDARADR